MPQLENARELNEIMAQGRHARQFMMPYKFAIDETMTKLNILKEEFNHARDYSPIEHISHRLKSPESILAKARRQGHGLSLDEIRANIRDIAGIRVTCGFISDTYKVCDMLTGQHDVTVLQIKDYIKNPKPNGYKSLHVILRIPVFRTDRVEQVNVEIQIRTIAMDFWASLEHKIYYKYDRDIPPHLLDQLKEAADVANRLDMEMEQIHDEVANLHPDPEAPPATYLSEPFLHAVGQEHARRQQAGRSAATLLPAKGQQPGHPLVWTHTPENNLWKQDDEKPRQSL